jgi:hypothetical protein
MLSKGNHNHLLNLDSEVSNYLKSEYERSELLKRSFDARSEYLDSRITEMVINNQRNLPPHSLQQIED